VRAGIRARNLILKARSAHETRVEEELVSPVGILEIYLLLYVFVKPRVFPPASSQPRLYDLSPVRPSIAFSPRLAALTVSRYPRERLPRHLDHRLHDDRYVSFLAGSLTRRGNLGRYLAASGLHQISHVAEHSLNLLTLWASRPETREDLAAPYCQPIKTSRKLNIIRRILHLPFVRPPLVLFKIYYLIPNSCRRLLGGPYYCIRGAIRFSR
jgi:hypothetical protein